MSVTAAMPVFAVAAAISLSTGWVLVASLERLGERFGLSEGLLGMVAALAADAPEITSAITALAHREQTVGAGVVIGSNVFNLAALLGLSAVIAGRVALHRRVVVFGGAVGTAVAGVSLICVLGLVPPGAGLALLLAVLLPYVIVLGLGPTRTRRLPLSRRFGAWLAGAVADEERELIVAIHPRRAGPRDAVLAAAALVIVVGASVAMERAATEVGRYYKVPDIVVGALVLAAVTSLPNAVAAGYLASRGRGAAVLSTTLNSNALNVAVGLLIPATVVGLGKPSGQTTVITAWYMGLTIFALALAYRAHGLRRLTGALIIATYAGFVAMLTVIAYTGTWP
jgi:cation:H+ antiporter